MHSEKNNRNQNRPWKSVYSVRGRNRSFTSETIVRAAPTSYRGGALPPPCVRMGACAYMRGYGTVRGGGMRLSDVGSCLVIVAWCNCCMCNYMGMVSRPGLYGVVVFAWFMVVSTRRGMLVAAMVLAVVCDTDLHSVWGACIVIAINHGTTRKKPRDEHHGD